LACSHGSNWSRTINTFFANRDALAPPDLANALCVLAMTRHQLGQHFQANRMLEQSFEIAKKLPNYINWSIRVPLQVLQREARGLIQDGPIVGEKQTGEARKQQLNAVLAAEVKLDR
jgi:hypothetical protein